ncbi:hypothetical protein JR316_0004932 [Psilocybe cubensis]|uniref:Uncharacterized protein n=2 Tax=Psilocybe cubensis TaxID=181762 RepID=A0ACB8H5B0_PSICU|nr:hypothetical protein JR316_0004932 [Psilocybe cubensis]KAH9482832.1 hypothetical protein JR316_0004932 [Psilocybe cubensis]
MASAMTIQPLEKHIKLSDSRILAYSDNGNSSSSCVVIFFHGAFGVGNATRLQPSLVEADVHFIAPTLPGWGTSTPRDQTIPYHVSLASDITQLIQHLHPDESNLSIYIAGGSFGTVPAQILYGAPFDIFPLGRNIKGCMVLAPFSPFRLHKDYAKTMTTQNYMAVGPPTQFLPFHILPRLSSFYMRSKLKTIEDAEAFIRQNLFDNMKTEEKEAFRKWREEHGKQEGEVEREFAENMVRSVAKTWDGYLEIADVIHGDWGFKPDGLDEERNRRPILIVGSEGDTMAPDAMAKWLAASYKNAHFRSINGGHLAALFHLDGLWKELLEL